MNIVVIKLNIHLLHVPIDTDAMGSDSTTKTVVAVDYKSDNNLIVKIATD